MGMHRRPLPLTVGDAVNTHHAKPYIMPAVYRLRKHCREVGSRSRASISGFICGEKEAGHYPRLLPCSAALQEHIAAAALCTDDIYRARRDTVSTHIRSTLTIGPRRLSVCSS